MNMSTYKQCFNLASCSAFPVPQVQLHQLCACHGAPGPSEDCKALCLQLNSDVHQGHQLSDCQLSSTSAPPPAPLCVLLTLHAPCEARRIVLSQHVAYQAGASGHHWQVRPADCKIYKYTSFLEYM